MIYFGVSRTHAEWHDQRARQLAGPAQAALAQDDTLRQAKASLIEQGDKAERKLNWLLRGRLADAIRDRALLPMWFVTVLGPVPPAHKTQEWMDHATQVLAYRVTYGITDQVVALGPALDEYTPRRTEWHPRTHQEPAPLVALYERLDRPEAAPAGVAPGGG
ncbi:hypothetical protein ABT218_21455 [Streptomyces sp. NPDC001455]|uniref:hypothetical protein n=1 Tax=Streptomyces sp. NPDC001455 TaxID=3154518 RepID=UPI00331834B8